MSRSQKRPNVSIVGTIAAAIVAVTLFVLSQTGGQMLMGINSLTVLRQQTGMDQIGYLSMSANARAGHATLAEPMTMTGINHYPTLYYTTIGWLARLTGQELITVWNVLGLGFQIAAVFAVAVVMSIVGRRWWYGMFAAVPFLTGVLSWILTTKRNWYVLVREDSHAVLWGTTGEFFARNGGAVADTLVMIAVALLFWAWGTERSYKARLISSILAAMSVGLAANMQTYGFLFGTYLLMYAVSFAAIWRSKYRLALGATTLVLFVVVVSTGALFVKDTSQMAGLIFGLVPTIPAFLFAIKQSRWIALWAAIAGALVALPQILWTAYGAATGDPFLAFRQTTTIDLSVVAWVGLIAALPVLVPLVGALVVAIMRNDALAGSASAAGIVVFAMLAVNEQWGIDTEPYRFWIIGFVQGGVIAALCWAKLFARSDAPKSERWATRRSRAIVLTSVVTMTLTAALFLASLPDMWVFVTKREVQVPFNTNSPRQMAINELTREAAAKDNAIIGTDVCIEQGVTKSYTDARFASYFMGMAWPKEYLAINDIQGARMTGHLDMAAMQKADVRWYLTDSSCEFPIPASELSALEKVDTRSYSHSTTDTGFAYNNHKSGEITLWRVPSTN